MSSVSLILHVYNPTEAATVCNPHLACTLDDWKREVGICKAGRGQKIFFTFVQIVSDMRFIAPIPEPNPIPSQVPCYIRDWVDDLPGLYVSMILLPRLQVIKYK